jgi:hypothetical protein
VIPGPFLEAFEGVLERILDFPAPEGAVGRVVRGRRIVKRALWLVGQVLGLRHVGLVVVEEVIHRRPPDVRPRGRATDRLLSPRPAGRVHESVEVVVGGRRRGILLGKVFGPGRAGEGNANVSLPLPNNLQTLQLLVLQKV